MLYLYFVVAVVIVIEAAIFYQSRFIYHSAFGVCGYHGIIHSIYVYVVYRLTKLKSLCHKSLGVNTFFIL